MMKNASIKNIYFMSKFPARLKNASMTMMERKSIPQTIMVKGDTRVRYLSTLPATRITNCEFAEHLHGTLYCFVGYLEGGR